MNRKKFEGKMRNYRIAMTAELEESSGTKFSHRDFRYTKSFKEFATIADNGLSEEYGYPNGVHSYQDLWNVYVAVAKKAFPKTYEACK